jgi:hypothetical protein
MHKAQRHINHVALVLDASVSMRKHARKVVQVADEQIRHLALRSEELSQETRVSIYTFSDKVECIIFDMDVMRLPSIADLYSVYGRTALIDAAIQSQSDLGTTSQLYGDHGFLTFVITDGEENQSRRSRSELSRMVSQAPDNWNIAWLVPDSVGKRYVEMLGVNAGNIAIWDATSSAGFEGAGQTIKAATESFMTSRGTGQNWAKNGIFSTGVDAVNDQTVKTTLTPLNANGYQLLPVHSKTRIDERVNTAGIPYRVGKGYYELSKTENIQPQKDIIIVEKATGKAYSGAQARDLIGLPHGISVKVKPDYNPLYKIFVQSTSVNRNLMPNTEVLVLA